MPSAFHLACIFLALIGGLAAGLTGMGPAPRPWRAPFASLAVAALLGATFTAQLARPELLPLLERNEDLLRRLEVWRVLTALFAQDGWGAGFAFNLTILLVVGSAAERRMGSARWLIVYFGAGMLTEGLALAWQPVGAGNSIAVFGLAGALTALGAWRTAGVAQLCSRLVAAAAGAMLLVMRDIHGLGFGIGAVIIVLLTVRSGQPATTQA